MYWIMTSAEAVFQYDRSAPFQNLTEAQLLTIYFPAEDHLFLVFFYLRCPGFMRSYNPNQHI
jgi:hypothetical protein